MANRIWEVRPGRSRGGGSVLTVYPGNLNDYLHTWQRLKKGSGEEVLAEIRKVKPKSGNGSKRSKAARRQEAEERKRIGRETRKLRDRVSELEDLSSKKEAELEEVNAALADPGVYQDPDRAAGWSRKAARLRAELDRLQEEWTRAVIDLEEAQEAAQRSV